MYAAEVVLGVATDTDDAEGNICQERRVPELTQTEIGEALTPLWGDILQTPPQFSAVKKDGKTAYTEARKGREVDLAPRPVRVDSLQILSWQKPRLRLLIKTGPGTYVRSLARDAGRLLGTVAYLHSLTRLASGHFTVESGMSLAGGDTDVRDHLLPADSVVLHLAAAFLSRKESESVRHGAAVRLGEQGHDEGEVVRLYSSEGNFLALARNSCGHLRPFQRLGAGRVIVDWAPSVGKDSVLARSPLSDSATPYAMTIGSFDGVHRGHQSLLRAMVRNAHESGLKTVLVTFDPLPREVFTPAGPPSRLTDINTRLSLFEALGIDCVRVIPFSQQISLLSASDFLSELMSHYRVKKVWAGEDFAFGHQRQGTISFLEQFAASHSFEVYVVPRSPLSQKTAHDDTTALSSSRVRDLIREGNMLKARHLLRRSPGITGIVVHGAGRGKQLGYPTANLRTERSILIAGPGIYAAWACVNGETHACALSIGNDPTFGTNPLSIEAHLLDFDYDIYGRRLSLFFIDRLRDERRFESVEALISQMGSDVERVRTMLSCKDNRFAL